MSEVISIQSSEISPEISSEKILGVLRAEPALSARVVAERLGISARAVEKHIAKPRDVGKLKRIGPAKERRWEVV